MMSHNMVMLAQRIAQGGGGGGFTPASLSSLILWCEADTQSYTDSGTTLCSNNNDRLAQWNDLSGGGNNLTQATNKPWYKTNLSNGKPGMAFYYPDLNSSYVSSTQANNQKPVSFAFICRVSDVTANRTILAGRTGTRGICVDINASHFRFLKEATTLIGQNTSTLANNTFYIVVITYDSSGNYAWTVNGSADGSGTNDQAFDDPQTRIGCTNDGASALFNGDILAFAKGSAVWTGTEISNLTSYWNTKYAIY